MVDEEQDIYIGKRIKSHTIQEKLGSGGSAHVYLSQNELHEYAAIKLLNPKMAQSEGRHLFRHEAQVLQDLKYHHYILPIVDYGDSEGTPYIVTEYMPGGTLRKWINTSRTTEIEKLLTVLLQISKAVYAIHLHNILHNDLKPENILFNWKGDVALADFGISIRLGRRKKIFSCPRGTYAYMAPEQFDGVYAKEGDQYALGCIAYELLTGSHPFEHLPHFNPYDREMMKERHRSSKPLSPSELNSAVSADIEQAILKSMAKLPSERHTNITAFIRSLQSSFLLQPQSFHHFTYPLDTPPPYTSSFAEALTPANPPGRRGSSLDLKLEVCEPAQIQAYIPRALHYPNSHHFSGHILPQNVEDDQIKDTDHAIIPRIPAKPEGITAPGTKKAKPNPFKTRNLQLSSDLEGPLSDSLKHLGLKPYEITRYHPISQEVWRYTAIAVNGSESPPTNDDFVPNYSILYFPGIFLTKDTYLKDLSMLFQMFSDEVLIIVSDTKQDFATKIDLVIENAQSDRGLIIGKVKTGAIDDLKNIVKKDTERYKIWAKRYLMTDHLSLNTRKMEPADMGILEKFIEDFLERTHDVKDYIERRGSTYLQQMLFDMNLIIPGALSRINASNIAHSFPLFLQQRPDNADHTLPGEFLCIVLQKEGFLSKASETAQSIRGIIRKYRLGPISCPYCSKR